MPACVADMIRVACVRALWIRDTSRRGRMKFGWVEWNMQWKDTFKDIHES